MNPLLLKWFDSIAKMRSHVLAKSVRVEGRREKFLGPRADFAAFEVLCQPAEALELDVQATNGEEARRDGYVDQAIFGVLDVLLTQAACPVRNVRLIVTSITIHPTDSSQMAFRLAGRDAGMKILRAMEDKG